MDKDKSIKLTSLDYNKPDDNEELLRISAKKVLNSYATISPLIIGEMLMFPLLPKCI